jgi:hypothetical protein
VCLRSSLERIPAVTQESLHRWSGGCRGSCAASWATLRIRIGAGIPGSHYLRTMRTMPVMQQRRQPVLAVADFVSVYAAADHKSAIPGVGRWAWWRRACGFSVPPQRAAGAHLALRGEGASACWVRACGARRRSCIPARARDTAGMSDARRSTK